MNYNQQKFFSRLTVVLITASSYVIGMCTFLFFKNLDRILVNWSEAEKITIYVESEITQNGIDKLKNSLEKMPEVKKIKFYNKEEVLNEFTSQVAGFIQTKKMDNDLVQAVPSYFEISISPMTDIQKTILAMNDLKSRIEIMPDVEEVSYATSWIEKYADLVNQVMRIHIFVVIILLVSSYFVISNAVKTNIYHRAKEIEILEMIGATPEFISKPFVIEGVSLSALSFLLSTIVVFVLLYAINEAFAPQIKVFKLERILVNFSLLEFFLFLVGSLFIGFFSSYLNIRGFKWNAQS